MSRARAFRRCLGLLVGAGVLLAAAATAHAARLLQFTIELDGKVILHTLYQDSGRPDAPAVWGYWGKAPITAVEKDTSVKPDAEDAKTATLKGDLRLRIQHVDRVIAEARVESLRLIRQDAADDRWFLPREEVQRTAP
jgi:hypothetical protein